MAAGAELMDQMLNEMFSRCDPDDSGLEPEIK